MANKGFNGTTFTFANVSYALTGIDLSVNGAKVDVTDTNSSSMLYQVGLPDYELTVDVKGSVTPAVGATGAAALGWKDGTNSTLPSLFIVTNVKVGGKLNAPIESSFSLAPSTT